MIDSATSLLAGHLQVRRQDYLEDERFEDTIAEVTPLLRTLSRQPHVVSVAPRIEAFALVSADERSFGAQVLGVDIDAERNTVRFVNMLKDGRQLQGPNDALSACLKPA
jgi:ABC-type lipoprotein release transport system permease subunit